MLISWSVYNYSHDFRIENQILWYNSDILVHNTPFFWKDCYYKGLKYVFQLFENMSFKTYQDVKDQFGLSTLRYNSIKKAIPHEWKIFFLNTPELMYQPIPPHTYDLCVSGLKTNLAAQIYKYINWDISLLHNKFVKWEVELGQEFNLDIFEYGRAHRDIYRTTNVAKYRSFQYRLLQHGLVTNIQLAKWGLQETNLCTFCRKELETVTDLLTECQEVKQLWEKVHAYLDSRFTDMQITLQPVNIIMNTVGYGKSNVINFICLIYCY